MWGKDARDSVHTGWHSGRYRQECVYVCVHVSHTHVCCTCIYMCWQANRYMYVCWYVDSFVEAVSFTDLPVPASLVKQLAQGIPVSAIQMLALQATTLLACLLCWCWAFKLPSLGFLGQVLYLLSHPLLSPRMWFSSYSSLPSSTGDTFQGLR